jgi:hypothetical protein
VLTDLGPAEVGPRLAQRTARTGRPCFAEEYIEGREFNLALLAGERRERGEKGGLPSSSAIRLARSQRRRRSVGISVAVGSGLNDRNDAAKGASPLFSPEALPPAEILFSAYPPDKPRIVGHRAKWQADSFEYQNTPRRFDFDAADGPLLDQLRDLARRCWTLFGLGGWVRVDFRVDAAGRPWILEVNTNPCLSPDAGFAAALHRASVPFDEAIRRILEDAV